MISHVMVDLETLGTVPGCIGFAIGAVEFFPETQTLGREFYKLVDVQDSIDHFLIEDPATVEWWSKRSPEARAELDAARNGDGVPLAVAMVALNDFLLAGGAGVKGTRLYGNGADFDNPILRVMWSAANIQPFGSKGGFFGGRCYRTLKTLDELFGPQFTFTKLQRTGTHHNGLDDAKAQAVHLMENLARLKEKLK